MEYAKFLALTPIKITMDEDRKTTEYNFYAKLVCNKTILEIDRYSGKELTERWFIDNSSTQLQWLKYDVKSKKRSSRASIYCWHYKPMSVQSEKIVNKFLGETDGIKGLNRLQERIISRRKREKEEFIQSINNKIDNEFSAIPNGLEDWIHERVISDDRYIFYKYKREFGLGACGERINCSHYDGYCTRCNQHFDFWDKPTHDEETFCPMCGETATYKADGLSRKKLNHTANIAFPQTVDGENFVIRCFHVKRDYTGKYENVRTHLKEFARYYYTKNHVWYSKNEAKYGMFSSYVDELNYYQLTDKFTIFDGVYWFYGKDLYRVLSGSYLKYQQKLIQEFVTESQQCYRDNLWDAHIEFLRYLTVYPKMEYLLKLKLHGLVKSIVNSGLGNYNGYYGDNFKKSPLNLKGKTAEHVLGMPYNTLRQFLNYENMSTGDLQIAQFCVSNKLIDCYELIKRGGYNAIIELNKIAKIVPMRKVLNYMERNNGNIRFNDYYDYISGCQKLNCNLDDTVVLKPKDFKIAHDSLNVLIKVQENAILEIPIKAAHEAYSKLVEWTDGKIQVILAKDSADIIREGQQQNHCVGRYCERVAKGESLVLFLRKATELEKGFYTMEIRPDMHKLNNVQCRGVGNVEQSEEVTEFLRRYEKWFNRREIKGSDPSKVIAKYYKAVKKMPDGRYISAMDCKTEFKIGEVTETEVDTNPDKVAVKGLHIASMAFAQNFGNHWSDVAILEVEVNLNDVIVPDAADQIRTSKFKVLREVPMEEMGEWGERHTKFTEQKTA